jgi:hypothetical protein
MAGPYLPLWQRQRLLAGVGAKIITPAPAPPEPAPVDTTAVVSTPPRLWPADAPGEPEPYPPLEESA